MDKDTLLTFPCDFPLKVVGLCTPEFEIEVLTIVRKHVAHLKEDAIKTRLSHQGKYLSMTITITVDSKEQLDNLYKELSTNEHILVAL